MAESETTRLEAFSDGVFAIAITLLILEIKVPAGPETQDHGLWRALLERWPSYVGYVISFATIGIMWVNHHALFKYIRRVDRALLLANLLLLMTISFLPYPTAVLAEHLSDAGLADAGGGVLRRHARRDRDLVQRALVGRPRTPSPDWRRRACGRHADDHVPLRHGSALIRPCHRGRAS